VLDEPTTKEILARYGLQAPRESVAASADEATLAAQGIGFPVVLKVVADGVTHKTDVGGVRLDLADEAAVRQAFEAIRSDLATRAPNAAFRGVLVGEQVRPGLEVILAIQRDPDMGVVLMLGIGGTAVELARRVSFRKPPLNAGRAEELIEEAGLSLLLRGYRGGRPLDRSALVNAILSLSALAQDAGSEIQTLEINPLAVLEDASGVRVLDAVAVLAPPARPQ
jgi:acyl-CoA synthetase (NDP forming)